MVLTSENYFSPKANMAYMSVSQFKSFEQCQAAAMAELSGEYSREETPALLTGSYVDAYFEGTLDLFRAGHANLFKRDGTLKAEYVKAEEIIKRIERDRFFMQQLAGRRQVIMTGKIADVAVKVKIDSLLPDRIVDLKIMKDFEPLYVPEQGRLPWFEAWRYDLQGAVYQEVVRQNTGKRLPFYLAAATKEKETDLEVLEVEQELLDFELERFTETVGRYDAIKKGILDAERCEHCDYCKRTKVLTAARKSGDFVNE